VSAQVVPFPRRQVQEVPLTLEALRLELGVSVRFLRYRIAEGMPSQGFDYRGRRIFLASECRAWLDERQKRMGRN
jgi:hypothetical protein